MDRDEKTTRQPVRAPAGGAAFGAVIRRSRTALGLSQEELAAFLVVSRNTVAGWETGHSRPDMGILPSLCRALKISLNCFFGLQEGRSAEERHILDLFFSLEEGDRQIIVWEMEALFARREEQFRKETLAGVVSVYVSDLSAAAGIGTALEEERGEYMYLLRDRETERADQVITVCGNSMEPTFQDGDQVLVSQAQDLRPGEIGIFLVDNEGYIKEYQRDGLHSHNPAYRTMRFGDGQTVRCVGRVIGKLKPEQLPTGKQLRILEEAEKAVKAERRTKR